MLQWFEEAGVEAVMLVATLTALAVFLWATGTMLVRWLRYDRARRLASEPVSRQSRHLLRHGRTV